MNRPDDQHFRLFTANVERAIAKYGKVADDQLSARQEAQVNRLSDLEEQFRTALIKHPWGPVIYRQFVHFICEEKRNILAARPYFRERQTVFTSEISTALKRRADLSLYPFHFNYQFVLFVLGCKPWKNNRRGARILRLAKEISDIRTELMEMNLPLAISRARIFFSRTPQAHLEHMDLVQITAEGLMAGIDKFVGAYTPSWRAMVIQRMVGNLIENYSETLLHFYPGDKRKLYRANKMRNRHGENPDFEQLANEVNEGADAEQQTTAEEIADIMAASSTVSAETPVSVAGDEEPSEALLVHGFAADESTHPDVRYEQAESMALMQRAFASLPLLHQKLLRLRGVSL